MNDGLSAVDAAAEYHPYLGGTHSRGEEHDRQRACQTGFEDHWMKPVTMEQLKEILKQG